MKILFENRDIVVCIKPAGVQSEDTGAGGNVRPAAQPASVPTSVPALLRVHWGRPDAPVFCVHRLDTATGGVMVYAKTKAAAAALSAQLAGNGFSKEYLCVCAGILEPAAGEMHDFLFKDSRKNKVFPVKGSRKGAKEASLHYTVLAAHPSAALPGGGTETAPVHTLCRVTLHTGRTHQIRVQFASRKHPLYGDGKYGSREKGPLGLWCFSLSFTAPGEKIPRTFSAAPQGGIWAEFPDTAADIIKCSFPI